MLAGIAIVLRRILILAKTPLFISDDNLSHAWARAFQESMKPGQSEIIPLVINITGFQNSDPTEDIQIRQLIDEALQDEGEYKCDTVANTIFPNSFWNPTKDRELLYQRYHSSFRGIKKSASQNRYGLYFERLVNYGTEQKNQLEHIINTYQGGNHRRSALQASIFDPSKDHTNQPLRGFPCLQHVTFIPDAKNKELTVTGFYAMQYIFRKGYGNYLGLARLGKFIAHELGFKLTGLTCMASIAKLEISKCRVQDMSNRFEEILLMKETL